MTKQDYRRLKKKVARVRRQIGLPTITEAVAYLSGAARKDSSAANETTRARTWRPKTLQCARTMVQRLRATTRPSTWRPSYCAMTAAPARTWLRSPSTRTASWATNSCRFHARRAYQRATTVRETEEGRIYHPKGRQEVLEEVVNKRLLHPAPSS